MISMMNAMVTMMKLTDFLELFNTQLVVKFKGETRLYLHTDGQESINYLFTSNSMQLYGNKIIPGLGTYSLQYEHDKKRIKYYRTYKLKTHEIIFVPMCDTEEEYFQNSLLYDHSQITFEDIQLIKQIYEKVSQC